MSRDFAACKPYLANQDQLCYARLARLEEGTGRGQRIVDVCNGTGLQFTITPDRAMNLVECSFLGIPIAFRASPGHRGTSGDWLHNWTAGMMTTAGLRNIGSPSGDQPLHGYISGEAAEHLSLACRDGEIAVSGVLREGALADLSIIDTDNTYFLSPAPFLANLVYGAHSDCIDSVICGGRVVMRHREVPGEQEILAQARHIINNYF